MEDEQRQATLASTYLAAYSPAPNALYLAVALALTKPDDVQAEDDTPFDTVFVPGSLAVHSMN